MVEASIDAAEVEKFSRLAAELEVHV